MLKKMIWCAGLLPAVLCAQAWKEDFSKLDFSAKPTANNWSGVNVKMVLDNSSYSVTSVKGTPSIFRRIPYDFNSEVRYLQMRVISGDYRILLSTNLGTAADWFMLRPGLYTFPVFEMTRPDLSGKPMKGSLQLRMFIPRRIQFSELATADKNTPDTVIFTVTGPDGKIKDSRTPAVAGDTVTIEMQVKDKPDNLSLYLYKINDSKNWVYRGRWESLTLPGVPLQLKESKIPNRYQASFTLRKMQTGLKIGKGNLIAAINYLGADSNDRGYYYGFCPNPIELEQGEQTAATSSALKVFDFGPPNGPAAPDAIVINRTAKHPSFRWIRPPRTYTNGFRKTLDALLMDWAVVGKKSAPEMEIKVKPGKYKVVIGIGAANTMCWLNGFCRPLQGKFYVNKKLKWEFNGGDRERFLYLDRPAKKSEKVYDVYMKPYIKDLTTETTADNGKINIRIAAGNSYDIPLNYVAVYPAEDKEAEEQLARMQAARRKVFDEFWDEASPSEKDLRKLLSISFAGYTGDYAVFARANPGEFIFFNTMPEVSERNAPMRLLASPGQYSVGMILLRTFRELKDTTATIELEGFPGASVSFVMPYRFASYSTRKHFTGPNHFVPAGKRDLEANQSYSYRVCVKTPENMKRGTYTGKVTFTGNGKTQVVPVEIRVTSEKLPILDDHLIGMFGVPTRGKAMLNGLKFCKEDLGCTTVPFMRGWPYQTKFKTDANGFPVEVIVDRAEIKAWYEAYKAAGFPVKTPVLTLQSASSRIEKYRQGPFKIYTKEYEAALKLQYELYRDYAIKYGGATGIVADLGGEMGYGSVFPKQEVMDAAIEVFKQVSRIPNVQASYRCNCSETTKQFYPYLQIQGVRDPGSWPVSDRQSNYGKNKHLYTYSIGGRVYNGLHSWAHGARGSLREFLYFGHQIEYNDFLTCCGYCGGTFHLNAMKAPGDKFLPTMRSDGFRESVIDRQYLRLLENEVKRSRNAAAKKKAENFMTILRNRADAHIQPQGVPWLHGNNVWPGIRLDMMREAIVQLCEELRTGKAVLPEFTAMERKIKRGIPPEPSLDVVTKAPESRKGFKFAHWRSIRTGECWEKQGLPYDGCAWYRKNIRIPKGWQTPVLRIGSADEVAWVFCNGKYLGTHREWNEPFQFALDNAEPGSTTEIAIMVYDSMNMGGIWRSVTLHRNMQDAQNNRNGVNLDADWKIALKPFGRKLDLFEFSEGPLVPADTEKAEVKIMLIPQDNAGLEKLKAAESAVEIRDLKGNVLSRCELGKVHPYDTRKYVVNLKGITEKVCDAVLVTGGSEFARFRFYRIDFWKP